MNKTKDQRPQECKYCVNNHCQHPYYNDCDCVLWRCNLFTPKTETITQKEIEKAAENYAQKEVNKYDRDIIGLFKNDLKSECQNAFFAGVNFALSKQEKNAENTPISERLAPEEKSQLEGIYYYLKRAADKQENESVSVAVLFEVMERLEDIFSIDLLTNGHMKSTPKDADPVIQGWAAHDEDGALYIYEYKPKRVYDTWAHENVWIGEILLRNVHTKPFFNLAWEDEPQEVEITIKRKKNE